MLAAVLAQGDPEPPRPEADLRQPQMAAGTIAYPATFFASSRPNNAFEMLQRLPGFTFSGGAEVRGFAGAAGNVLIDGERPSSKSVSLEDLLKRIPASAVERIDLIRGGAPGIDMQGLPLVANVVRSRTAVRTTAVTAGGRFYADGPIGPQLDVEWSQRRGDLSLEGAAHLIWETDTDSGEGRLSVSRPDGLRLSDSPFSHKERGRVVSANGAAALNRGADVWRLNLGASREDDGFLEAVTADRKLLRQTQVDQQLEAGGDYEHTFSDTLSARVVALQTLKRGDGDERSQEPGGVQTSTNRQKEGETILRATATHQRSAALSLEAGAEGAFNFLDAASGVTDNGVAIVLPNANVRVEERRAEGFVTASWKPTARLSVEAGARVETSRISQSGDTRLTRAFFFPKPRAIVTYTPDPDSQVRLRIEREVGQLDFGDFAAQAELSVGTVNAGNANLEPERAWVVEAAFERRFWGKGALVATFAHAEVQQVVDLIPIDGRFDAPGNIGAGTRDQVRLTATLPLDRLGLSGGLIAAEGTLRRSKVADPVTGQARRISSEIPFEGQIRFSQDLSGLRSTWGVDADFARSETQYRIDEVRRTAYQTYVTAYWDWKPRTDLSVRAEVQNVTGRDFRRRRTFFDGPRLEGQVDVVERRNLRFDPFIYLRVRKVL